MFTSQAETLAQFGAEEECFRIAPRYDFTQPPHAGRVMYEYFPWGMIAYGFCTRAALALRMLGHEQVTDAAEGTSS